MAFGHGKACDVYVNGRDLGPFFSSASAKLSAETAETTTLGKSSKTFIAGLKDSMFSVQGYFDSAANTSDQELQAALGKSTDSLVVIYPVGDVAIGDFGYAMRARGVSYDSEAPVGGVVPVSADFQGDNDADRVISHHVLGVETAAADGASVDNAAATTAGAAAHLHVTAFTGTSITVKMQDSADNAAWLDIGSMTFTAASAAGTSERVATTSTATIRRYTRVSWSGTFTSATFHVAFSRK